jgi:uncharacterized protein (TIGR03435 family)
VKLLIAGLLAVVIAGSVYAQAPTTPPPYVASPIRKNVEGRQGGTGFRPGMFVMTGGTIRQIFLLAYPSEGIDPIGAPDWLSTERFDLTVRFDQERLPQEQLQAVFREIFATQLKMKVHYERRDAPTYSMVVARGDGRLGKGVRNIGVDCDARRDVARRGEEVPTLPPAGNGVDACQNKVGNGTVLSGGIRFSQLASIVRNPAGRLILDETGLDGFYEFSLEWAPGPGDPASPDPRPNIFTAFEEQLGLKLKPSTTSVEVVVIDHVERPPAP